MIKKFFKKHGKMIVILFTVFIGIVLIVSAISMLFKYKNEITERSSSAAQYNTLVARTVLEDKLDNYTYKAIEMATIMSKVEQQDVYTTLRSFEENSVTGILFSRYFDKDGILRENNGDEYTLGIDESLEYRKLYQDKAGYVGTFEERSLTSQGTMSVIGFYAPVTGSDSISGIVNYYTRQALVELFTSEYRSEEAEFTVVCTSSGKILSGMENVEGGQIFTYLRELVGVKDTVDKVQTLVQNRQDGTVLAQINTDEYLISVGANQASTRDIAVIEMYRIDILYSSSLDFVQSIIAMVILFAIIVVGVISYLVFTSYQMKKRVFNMETTDVKLGCLNRHGFEKEAKRILESNINSYFAVVVVQLRHYQHLIETYPEAEIFNLVKYLKLTYSKTIQIEETYGYGDGGSFILLLHAKDKTALLERLKIHSFLAKQYKGNGKFDVLLRYGICEYRENDSVTVSQMIDFANEANNTVVYATVENGGMMYNFYSDELRQVRLLNENMELRMNDALTNGEFQIFYQPKYNIEKSKQDGSEALVRWYDAKTDTYNRPALFMKLFETNGFVVKLDKYVYTKVCEYLNYSIAKGRQVFPVSVNISRVTAIQTDFVEFYTRIKRRYNIPDGLLMIEFTESFAYENYDTLSSIVKKLHDNGFKCSIDDFGCGYSSYKILKTLPMDEIKLDKFFLEKGIGEERDRNILLSIINLGKTLNMKITQEGVETKEQLAIIKELGCDVVQGYYYAHPMGLNDYLNFVEHQAEHRI